MRVSFEEREPVKNLFLLPRDAKTEAGVVTTNMIIKSNGRATMGKGIAAYCRDNQPGIDLGLAKLIQAGQGAGKIGEYYDKKRAEASLDPIVTVIAFPTKTDWRKPSDISLIIKSATEIVSEADALGLEKIYMPAPGCGLGGLSYEHTVRPAIAPILDERFIVFLPEDMLHLLSAQPA